MRDAAISKSGNDLTLNYNSLVHEPGKKFPVLKAVQNLQTRDVRLYVSGNRIVTAKRDFVFINVLPPNATEEEKALAKDQPFVILTIAKNLETINEDLAVIQTNARDAQRRLMSDAMFKQAKEVFRLPIPQSSHTNLIQTVEAHRENIRKVALEYAGERQQMEIWFFDTVQMSAYFGECDPIMPVAPIIMQSMTYRENNTENIVDTGQRGPDDDYGGPYDL